MKILFVNHTFPPESYAGSELCVLYLAKEFQRQGHDVCVFYRYCDSFDEEYRVRKAEYQGVATYKINHTYRFSRSFQDIYVNSVIGAKFGYLLHELQPDVVHFHHLTNLSLSLVHEAAMVGCATVFTLHDYWLLCQRGQLLKRDMSLCHGPTEEGCRSCLSIQLLRGKSQQFVSKVLNRRRVDPGADGLAYDLLDVSKAEIRVPQKEFFQKTTFGLGEIAGETLLAHPPAEIRYRIRLKQPAVLKTAVAMHPGTYDQEGGGVRFEIEQNGCVLSSVFLNPKAKNEDKGWHTVEVNIDPHDQTEQLLILRTSPESPEQNIHCSAGWKHPLLVYRNSSNKKTNNYPARKKEIRQSLYRIAEILADSVAAFSPVASEGIAHRKNWVQRIWEETDLLISPSQFLRDFFIRYGAPAKKIVFSDNGFLPAPRMKAKRPMYPIRFGYIGTWIPSKGVDIALRAFRTIEPAKAKLIVHGFFPGFDGHEDYEEHLLSLAGPAVKFRGKYEPEKVYELLSEIDCLIMPSIWWENSPLTIHEAFQANVPIITANVGGMAEFVRDGGGLTFHHRDPLSLRAVIQKVIEDPEIIEDLQFSIPSVKSVSQHAEELLNRYRDIQKQKTAK